MKTGFGSYNIVFFRSVFFRTEFPGHFYHSLICFRPGILEENLIHTNGCAYFLGQQRLGNRIGIIKSMHNILHLIYHCGYYLFIAVSCTIYGNTRIKIQICTPIRIIKIHIFRRFGNHVKTFIGIYHIFADQRFYIIFCHSQFFEFHIYTH